MIEYVVVPLGDLISEEYDSDKLDEAFKKFSCERERDLENFLHYKAITYQKATFGITYLFLDKEKLDAGVVEIMAYFAISQRAVNISNIPKKRKRAMLGEYPGRDSAEVVPAFLIGQLGRSDSYTGDQLSGEQILNECYHAISVAAKVVGGKVVVLECREHMYDKVYKSHDFKKLYDEVNSENLYTLYKRVNFEEYWKKEIV